MSPTVGVGLQGQVALTVVCRAHTRAELSTREVWFLSSSDRGAHWTTPALLARQEPPFTNVAPNGVSQNPYLLGFRWLEGGDYWGMTGVAEGVLACWIDYADGYPRLRVRVL